LAAAHTAWELLTLMSFSTSNEEDLTLQGSVEELV
jgi:hypothetical protein